MFQYVKPQSTDSGLERAGLRMSGTHRKDQDEDQKKKKSKHEVVSLLSPVPHTSSIGMCHLFLFKEVFFVDLYTSWSYNRKHGSIWGPGRDPHLEKPRT